MKRIALILVVWLSASDAFAIDNETKEMIATVINLNGLLCATVTDVRKLQIANQYEVTCIEYRGGSGTVRYIVDFSKGTAFKAG